jgi:hypothetical protein
MPSDGLKRGLRPKQIDQHPEDKSAQIHHQASASSDSQSIASRNGFTVGTGPLIFSFFSTRPIADHLARRRDADGSLSSRTFASTKSVASHPALKNR